MHARKDGEINKVRKEREREHLHAKYWFVTVLYCEHITGIFNVYDNYDIW